jgi:hypothetical protein
MLAEPIIRLVRGSNGCQPRACLLAFKMRDSDCLSGIIAVRLVTALVLAGFAMLAVRELIGLRARDPLLGWSGAPDDQRVDYSACDRAARGAIRERYGISSVHT